MTTSITPYLLNNPAPIRLEALNDALDANAFTPCSSYETERAGWRQHGPNMTYARNIGNHILMQFMIEKRSVPGRVVKAAIKEEVDRFVQRMGAKPNREEQKQIKDDVLSRLLPRAFPKVTSVPVWVDAGGEYLMVGTSSNTVADAVFAALINGTTLFEGLTRVHTPISPSAAMARWLLEAAPDSFTVDDACQLVKPSDNSPTVKYVNHTLSGDDVRQHLAEGAMPVSLALTHNDQMSFQLTDKLVLKSLKVITSPDESMEEEDAEAVADASFVIFASAVGGAVGGLVNELSQ